MKRFLEDLTDPEVAALCGALVVFDLLLFVYFVYFVVGSVHA